MFALFDDEQILNATLRDYEKKGRAEGRAEGIGIGILENTKKLVFRLLGKNKSDEDIMDNAGHFPQDIGATQGRIRKTINKYGHGFGPPKPRSMLLFCLAEKTKNYDVY